MFTNSIKYKEERTFRIHVYKKDGNFGTGTGFFINKGKTFFTCFHVVFCSELKKIRTISALNSILGNNEHEKLKNYFNEKIGKIEVVSKEGIKYELELVDFNELFDIANLKIKDSNIKLSEIKSLNIKNVDFKQGDKLFFCGFPTCAGYDNREAPFAINTGIISSFPEITIAGDKYKHLQINSINLGGNSGAPLFKKNSNLVVGIINGNMNWGSDNIAFGQIIQNSTVVGETFRIPLSIAYATSFKLIREKTDTFN